jgi:multidrug efflux pump subunit AcrB
LPDDLCTQAVFVMLIGPACRNAVLRTEFAAPGREAGPASGLRSRPVLTASLVFLVAMVPAAIEIGTGAELRQGPGVALLAGMAGVTCCGVLLTPLRDRLSRRWPAESR